MLCKYTFTPLIEVSYLETKCQNIEGRSFFCSWSGGKDSCLALYRALQHGGAPFTLFTVMNQVSERSHSHALPLSVLSRQAEALQIPLQVRTATWETYETVFIDELRQLKAAGIALGVFGDIDIEDHRRWEVTVCEAAGLDACLPLWQESRLHLVEEFISLGFVAHIVTVKDAVLDESFLGRVMDRQLIQDLLDREVDPAGEGGEFHTVVTAGPIFSHPVSIDFGPVVKRDGYSFLICN
jgi:diphthine-ammonia ligase